MKYYYVYIIQCADNSYYTGITNNLERRIAEHDSGMDQYCYTYKRRPLKLVFQQQFTEVTQAIAFEKQIKRLDKEKERSNHQ